MGLRKTLTSLALIVASKDAAAVFSGTRSQNTKATLVICPLLMLSNWEVEIDIHLDLNLAKYTINLKHISEDLFLSVERDE
ncbi:uncharacterized protein VP01_10753g1 [Puccinia sorghi]|uniref:SNF2 N-terminal domain-containing protein n=1 Tax=Puccinia sorghi TaxID=27349 RepID=A0A0L6VUZ4_9BASI|nr:uncharacterized protein VP01_10753g1 [Puccinia sorghi]